MSPGVMIPVAYVSDDGDIWLERGSAPWPRIQHEAAQMARTIGDWGSVAIYQGIDTDVRVSDERETPHGDDDGCRDDAWSADDPTAQLPDDWTPCCRTVTAYHFRSEDPR